MTDATTADYETTAAPRVEETTEDALAARILLTILVALVAWGLCIFFWGIPGLYLPAVALVPVVWGALIAITMGN